MTTKMFHMEGSAKFMNKFRIKNGLVAGGALVGVFVNTISTVSMNATDPQLDPKLYRWVYLSTQLVLLV